MPHPQQISVAALGVGNVGSHFLDQLSALSKRLSQSAGSPVYVALVYASNSRESLFHHDYKPLDPSTASDVVRRGSEAVFAAFTVDRLTHFLTAAPGTKIVVDNTSSQAIADGYPTFLQNGISVIGSNKKPFSSSVDLFDRIYSAASNAVLRADATGSVIRPGHVFHESSVGAGLPIISTLKDLVESGDRVLKIEGVFSGTMSYLFNQFNPVSGKDSLSFSAAVLKANLSGFTEPDARDDLNGLDVGRKLVILARLCGWKLETSEFPIESLVPSALESSVTGDEFLAGLGEYDSEMEALKDEATSNGKVLRYVGSLDFETKSARVGMQQFDKSHPIAAIQGSDNIISFFTERYGSQPLIVQGAGAGGAVTAMGVTSDLLKTIRVTGP